MSKNLLLLKASPDVENEEVHSITGLAGMYGIAVHFFEINSFEDLHAALSQGRQYEYIYLATHGCEDFWGNISGSMKIRWDTFAAVICSTQIATRGAIFYHSCCLGGMTQVAYQMFATCYKIEYVCGPRHNLTPIDLLAAFNLLLYNIEIKNNDPVRAAEKVLIATDIRLVCFDRIEVAAEHGFSHHIEQQKANIELAFSRVLEYETGLYGERIAKFLIADEIYDCFKQLNEETYIVKTPYGIHKLKKQDGAWHEVDKGPTEASDILGAKIDSL